MPFGFWVLGNLCDEQGAAPASVVSNAFRLLGSGERILLALDLDATLPRSQMPFGFWVLGNTANIACFERLLQAVSNAFRLLGSGERKTLIPSDLQDLQVSNAFRLLGSGERKSQQFGKRPSVWSLKCLSAFGFWGTAQK